MRPALALPVLLLALLLAGCYSAREVETENIVATIPFPDEETSSYVLLNRDGDEELGRGDLIATRTGDQFEFQLNFSGDDGTDDTTVLVDAGTMKPDFVRRERQLDDTEILEARYDPANEVVNIITIINDEQRTVPLRLNKADYFDNETSLFLWRTIRFEEGYEASYYSVLANQRSIDPVTLRVATKEEITVPAGTFQTWRVEIRLQEGVRQAVWFADTPDHRVVQYDNSVQLLQLTSYESG